MTKKTVLNIGTGKLTQYMLIIMFTLLAFLLFRSDASAALSICSSNSNLHVIAPAETRNIIVTVTNTDTDTINWIKIDKPTQDYTVNNATVSGWTIIDAGDYELLINGTLDPGQTLDVTLSVIAPNYEVTPSNWIVTGSSDPVNGNSVICTGALDLTVTGPVQQAPVISNIQLSGLTTSSITILWNTDKPTQSMINYGTSNSYTSSTSLESTPSTTHSAQLTSLTPDTGYHYQIYALAQDGQTSYSSDNTFLTPALGIVSTSLSLNIATIQTEKVLPTISLAGIIDKPYVQTPTMTGIASDNVALVGIEYSTDGGQNWLPVTKVTGLGSKSAKFEFTPLGLEDADYLVVARAIDSSGNTARTAPFKLVIDRLPPIVGGVLMSSGPQVLKPSSDGTIISVVGVDQKITMSAVGGPTTIKLIARRTGSMADSQTFNLTQSGDTGLWSGIISFDSPGKFSLIANAVDGAGNKTNQLVSAINVVSEPFTYTKGSTKKLSSVISLYYLEPDTSSWVLWDGSSYSQINPQSTDSQGKFKLFLPPGKYYLKATAAGYQTVISNIFVTKQSQPITTTLAMKSLRTLKLGPLRLSWPSLDLQRINLTTTNTTANETQSNLINKPMPNFTLVDTNGLTVHATDLLGRPTLMTLGTTWSPAMSEQLMALSNLQTNKDLNIVPIALQEGLSKVKAYNSIAGLNLRWLVDPDSTISSDFGSPLLPTHYLIDRNGIIRQVLVGVISQKQIEDTLGSL